MGPGPEPPSDARLSCITLEKRTQHVIYESLMLYLKDFLQDRTCGQTVYMLS